eukprot:1141491-Pelagomonas_calceolata.AAC.4
MGTPGTAGAAVQAAFVSFNFLLNNRAARPTPMPPPIKAQTSLDWLSFNRKPSVVKSNSPEEALMGEEVRLAIP